MNTALPSFLTLQNLRLLAFGGKGGVGKTTFAAASALHLCKVFPHKKYMLVSTDPAHSILDSLTGESLPENLEVSELDATRSLGFFIEQHGDKLHEIASRGTFLDHEDITGLLGMSLPGLDEIVAFLEILEWVNMGGHDAVIVDTAPTGHTLRLLQMPQLVGKWLEVLDVLLGKHRYMKKVFSGAYHPDDVDYFLLDFSKSIENMKSLMRDRQQYRFVPVMTAEGLSVRETDNLVRALTALETPVEEVLVNRVFPDNNCPICRKVRSAQLEQIRTAQKTLPDCRLWFAPMLAWDVKERFPFEEFWGQISPAVNTQTQTGSQAVFEQKRVEWTEGRPDIEKPLLIFGGKGGVGKTTMACAAAVHISRNNPGKEVLLFSTDPAHSLSQCLQHETGEGLRKIAPGLSVAAIDGEGEFASLKQEYRAEIQRFLGGISPNLDLTFDREVMERIIDLSPPGLDEIMGVCKAMEFYEEKRFEVLVMDASPTGHMLRLLELPELIDQWLKVFFNIFLKYKNVFNVPGLTSRMIRLSKDLKKFRALLGDPDRTSLIVVSILTEMAYEETMDLLKACRQMGISAPALILNMATPRSSCGFCKALSLLESSIEHKYQTSCPEMIRAIVYRREEPRGLESLGQLGRDLYE